MKRPVLDLDNTRRKADAHSGAPAKSTCGDESVAMEKAIPRVGFLRGFGLAHGVAARGLLRGPAVKRTLDAQFLLFSIIGGLILLRLWINVLQGLRQAGVAGAADFLLSFLKMNWQQIVLAFGLFGVNVEEFIRRFLRKPPATSLESDTGNSSPRNP